MYVQRRGPRVQDLALVGLLRSDVGNWAVGELFSARRNGYSMITLLSELSPVRIEAFIKPRCDHL